MTVVVIIVTAVLAVAVVLTLIRAVRGPSTLDRIVSVDAMIVIVMAALATEAALRRNPTTLPLLAVLAILGFTASTGVARFIGGRDGQRHTPGRDE